MKIVFIVDDNDTNLMAAKQALEGHYKTFALPSAEKMFNLAEKIIPDLILLDIDMPEMDGFQAIEILKSNNKLKSIPVIFLTAKSDPAMEVRGFEMGAHDFIIKPFSTPVLLKRIETHIKRSETSIGTNNFEGSRQTAAADSGGISGIREKAAGERVGKIQSYLEILMNELIRTKIYDTEIYQISSKIKNEGYQKHAKMFTDYHYEKWDGTGYPRKLSGEEIPLEGRLMAVADMYDALVSERPYKKPLTHEQTIKIIKNGSGTLFDPKIIAAFMNVADEFLKISGSK